MKFPIRLDADASLFDDDAYAEAAEIPRIMIANESREIVVLVILIVPFFYRQKSKVPDTI